MRICNVALLVFPLMLGCEGSRTSVTKSVTAAAVQRPTEAQTASRLDYRLTVAGAPVKEATVWLYYSGYQYFDRLKLAEVRDGDVRVLVSTQHVIEAQPAPGDSGLTTLVALEIPGVGWYGPRQFRSVETLGEAIDGLGVSSPDGMHRVDLAAAVPQTLRLQELDGRPRPNQDVTLFAYETLIGHCARPVGFGEIAVRTDGAGMARFQAPLRELYLLATFFDENTKEERQGEMLSSGREHVVRKLWQKRRPERMLTFRLRRRDGKLVPMELFVRDGWDYGACSDYVRFLGHTSPAGDLAASVSLDDIADIWIGEDGKETLLALTDSEFDELTRTGEISVRWPRQ